jgi:hypothetical protein
MSPAILEPNTRVSHLVLDRFCDQDLAAFGVGHYTSTDVNYNTTYDLLSNLAFTHVQPDPDIESDLPYYAANGAGALDGLGRSAEGGEKTVSRSVDLPALKPG